MVDLTLLKSKKYRRAPGHPPRFLMETKAQEGRASTMLRTLPGLGVATYYGH
jgi:hypothetical protein